MGSLLSVYRIARSKYIKDLSGKGAELNGGRWNRVGVPVLYTSESRALCMLELMVHFSSKAAFKLNYEFAHIQVPEEAIIDVSAEIGQLDVLKPNNSELWEITDKHFTNGDALCLKVPSVLVPDEHNFLLNPNHLDFGGLGVLGFQSAFFDKRYIAML